MTVYKVKQVAEILAIHTNAVYRLVQSGIIPSFRISTGRNSGIRITEEQLRVYIEREAKGE